MEINAVILDLSLEGVEREVLTTRISNKSNGGLVQLEFKFASVFRSSPRKTDAQDAYKLCFDNPPMHVER